MSTLDKGVTYSGPDDEALRSLMARSRRWRSMSRTDQEEWVREHNARSTIVAHCRETGKPLVAEEIAAHVLNRIPANIRHLARMIHDLPIQDREDLIGLFADDSSLSLDQFIEVGQ